MEPDGDAVTRQFTFDDFPPRHRVPRPAGFVAEAADHHPDITINYKRVTLVLDPQRRRHHAEGDLDGARAASAIWPGAAGSLAEWL